MVLQANFQNGETVNYNGKSATVCSAPIAGASITIEVDGQIIRVDKNDLFGMNKDLKENTTLLDSQIEGCDKQIEENKSIIAKCNILWDAAKKEIKSIRSQMSALLSSFGAATVSQLDDAGKAQYKALREDRVSQRQVQIRASSDIMSAAINTSSVCSYKQDLVHTKMLGA